MLCFLNVLFIIKATLVLSTEEEHQGFHSVVNFPDNYQRYCAQFPLWPIFTARNSWIFGASVGSDPWTPSKALPWGPYSIPRSPAGKGNDLCMSARHRYKPNKLLVVWGGGHMKCSQIERGDQQFFCCFQGDQKFNRVFHPVSTTPPPVS